MPLFQVLFQEQVSPFPLLQLPMSQVVRFYNFILWQTMEMLVTKVFKEYRVAGYNNALYSRMKRTADTIYGTNQNIYGSSASTAILTAKNLGTEFKPTFQILNTYYMVWYDVTIIRMCDLYDSMKNCP
jgi:hypothetical protein